MRTLLITYDFPPIISGIGTFFYQIWKFLPREETIILAPAVKGYRNVDDASGVRMIRYPYVVDSALLRVALLLPLSLLLVVKERIDMLVCAVPVSIGIIGLVAKKMLRVPYCVFYYGGEYQKYKKNSGIIRILTWVLRNADCIITISDFSTQEVKRYGVEGKKVLKITPAVDTATFRPDIDCAEIRNRLGVEGKKILLTVARLVARKGIDAVINALGDIHAQFPHVVYVVIGKGEAQDYLKKLALRTGMKNHVIFLGFVPQENLPKYYNLCDIYIMPNRSLHGKETLEGFGISFIEASACGKPVIGGISGGVREAVRNNGTGLLVDPDDRVQLSTAVCRLLRDSEYALTLGRNGRKMTEQEFQWRPRAQLLRTVLTRIVTAPITRCTIQTQE